MSAALSLKNRCGLEPKALDEYSGVRSLNIQELLVHTFTIIFTNF
jgi:hypothetical protein